MTVFSFLLCAVFTLYLSQVQVLGDVTSQIDLKSCQDSTRSSDLKFHGQKTAVPSDANKCFSIDLKNKDDEVIIMFVSFSLSESDSVVIYSIGNDSAVNKIFEPFRGQRGSFSVFTGRSSVVLHLKTSTEKFIDRHFHAKHYTNECSYDEANSIWGTFASPIYEMERTKPVQCSYSFGFFGSTVRLQKLVLDFVQKNFTKANLTIEGSEEMDGSYAGSNIPTRLFSSNKLRLLLHLDPLVPHQRFVAHFQLANFACSGVVEVVKRSSFGLPPCLLPSSLNDAAPSSSRCYWLVRSKAGSDISISFDHNLSLVSHQDSLIVGGPKLSPLHISSGNHKQYAGEHIVSTSELWISFVSPNIHPSVSVQMTATLHDKNIPVVPGDSILRFSGSFTLAGNDNIRQLEVEPDFQVQLSLPPPPRRAALEIYSDFNGGSVPFLTLLPSVQLDTIVSPTQHMKVVSQGSINGVFYFKGVDRGCHKVSLSEADLYGISHTCDTCTWLIAPSSGSTVQLNFLKFNLEPDDLVSIHRINSSLKIVGTFNPQEPIKSLSIPRENGLLLKVTSQKCTSSVQIAYTMQPYCGDHYHLTKSGQIVDITSPMFPDSYPSGSECRWEISSLDNLFLLLSINSIHLAHSEHRLVIDGFQAIANKSLGPNYSISKSKKLKIVLSAPWLPHDAGNIGQRISSGFSISVTALDCGGTLKNGSGLLHIPSESQLCIWVLDNATFFSSQMTAIFFTSSISRYLTVRQWNSDGKVIDIAVTSNKDFWVNGSSFALLYNRSISSAPEPVIRISYRMQECKLICGLNKCMEAAWKCNGVNDCGDYKDELNCPVVPSPTPSVATPQLITSQSSSSTSSNESGYTHTLQEKSTTGNNEASGLSLTHVSLYIAGAIILGACIPTFVFVCLLKRGRNPKNKSDSRWTMMTNGHSNNDHADGISL